MAAGGDGYALARDAGRGGRLPRRRAGLAAAVGAARAPATRRRRWTRRAEALALFRGEVLLGAGDWAAPHRTRLEEVRLGLLEDALAARVDLGAGGEVVGELEALVDEHPLREGLWVSLITALYRPGRQADALAAYARVRRLLATTSASSRARRCGPWSSRCCGRAPTLEPPAVRRVRGLPGNLPAAGAPLVGRDDDLAAASALLAESPAGDA